MSNKTEWFLTVLERVVGILRPRYHNVLAWAVVVGGVSLAGGPVWEPYVRAALEYYFQLKIEMPLGGTSGVILVSIGLIYHFLINYVEQLGVVVGRKAIVEHDAPLFLRQEAIFDEDEFLDFLQNLGTDDAYFNNTYLKIVKLSGFFRNTGNKFLNNEIQSDAKTFFSDLIHLQDFLVLNFITFPNNQINQYCLYPDLNIDRGAPTREQMNTYASYQSQLGSLIDAVEISYRRFIATAHKCLGGAIVH